MILAQCFAGAGLGLLLGLLMGLSASPVVGLVVGAVAGLLASLLDVGPARPQADGESALHPARSVAVAYRGGVFGLTCVAGVLGGIYLRTHDTLSPPPRTLQEQVKELVAAGVDRAQAVEIVALPGHGAREQRAPAAAGDAGALSRTVLFRTDAVLCERIAVDRFATLRAAVDGYQAMGQPQLATVARLIDRRLGSEDSKLELMRAVVEALCAAP